MKPSYRIRQRSTGLYNDGRRVGSSEWSPPFYSVKWSKKGKIFFGKHQLRAYLDHFVTRNFGYLDLDQISDWEIIEVGGNSIPAAEFYHMWELLKNKLWEKSVNG